MSAPASDAAPVRDVRDADFDREVLARSAERPVVVDFWAPWCGPCRSLGPLLERLAAEHAGAFVLAKVNVDEEPRLAQSFAVRAIPSVLGFRDGKIVAEFTGAQPESAVRKFLASLLPSEADRAVEEAAGLAARGETARAEQRFRDALALDARHPGALLGLARALAGLDQEAEALELLERVTGSAAEEAEAERLAAELRTRLGGGEDEAALRARIAADPHDLAARLALGRALAGKQRWEEALAELLEVVRRDPRFEDEAARKAMLDVFAVLGAEHPLVARTRSELARLLFR
jgi:putative thioredoxin